MNESKIFAFIKRENFEEIAENVFLKKGQDFECKIDMNLKRASFNQNSIDFSKSNHYFLTLVVAFIFYYQNYDLNKFFITKNFIWFNSIKIECKYQENLTTDLKGYKGFLIHIDAGIIYYLLNSSLLEMNFNNLFYRNINFSKFLDSNSNYIENGIVRIPQGYTDIQPGFFKNNKTILKVYLPKVLSV